MVDSDDLIKKSKETIEGKVLADTSTAPENMVLMQDNFVVKGFDDAEMLINELSILTYASSNSTFDIANFLSNIDIVRRKSSSSSEAFDSLAFMLLAKYNREFFTYLLNEVLNEIERGDGTILDILPEDVDENYYIKLEDEQLLLILTARFHNAVMAIQENEQFYHTAFAKEYFGTKNNTSLHQLFFDEFNTIFYALDSKRKSLAFEPKNGGDRVEAALKIRLINTMLNAIRQMVKTPYGLILDTEQEKNRAAQIQVFEAQHKSLIEHFAKVVGIDVDTIVSKLYQQFEGSLGKNNQTQEALPAPKIDAGEISRLVEENIKQMEERITTKLVDAISSSLKDAPVDEPAVPHVTSESIDDYGELAKRLEGLEEGIGGINKSLSAVIKTRSNVSEEDDVLETIVSKLGLIQDLLSLSPETENENNTSFDNASVLELLKKNNDELHKAFSEFLATVERKNEQMFTVIGKLQEEFSLLELGGNSEDAISPKLDKIHKILQYFQEDNERDRAYLEGKGIFIEETD